MKNEFVDAFIEMVRRDCKKHGIDFELSPKDHVLAGEAIKCNGFFCGHRKKLAVATGKDFDFWFKTLIHEYGHMTQWKDQCKTWVDAEETNPSAESLVDDWLAHKKEFPKEEVKKYTSICRDNELDCERRVGDLVKKHNLPLDMKDYNKRANAYIYFWTSLRDLREWYTIGKEPYGNEKLVEIMPDHMDNDYEILPKNFKELYLEK